MSDDLTDVWDRELDEPLLRIGAPFKQVDPGAGCGTTGAGCSVRLVARTVGSWPSFADHPATHRLQHLLARACWNADEVRDDLQAYIAEQLGTADAVLTSTTQAS